MASRFTQYGGAAGADMALREMVAQRIAAQMEAQKQQQIAIENHLRARQVSQGDARIDLDADQLGLEREQFTAGAPQREAQTGYLRTQTQELERKPLTEADARAQAGLLQERGHQNELAQIQAQGNQQARVAGIRTSTQPSSADELKEFEAKEQIKAKYGGSRPSLGAERTALAYFNRAKTASEEIVPLEDEIAKKSVAGQAQLQYAPNWAQSNTNQSYRQSQRAFTEARLRKESGAAIPTAEYENDAKTYFAQPGDSQETLALKRRSRQAVLDGLKFASGKAYEEFFGEPNQSPAQQPGAPRGGVVPMVAPDGRSLMVPADNVAEMEAKGAKRR